MNPILRFLVLLLPITLFGIGTTSLSMAQAQPISGLSHQQQAMDISKVLRCPMATNQSLFESQAPIAHELKAQIFSMLEQGQSKMRLSILWCSAMVKKSVINLSLRHPRPHFGLGHCCY